MFQSVLQRLRDAQDAELEGGPVEAGFTLIELMVVLLIIAILLAIAIPTFLGVTGSANDRAAQSNLTNALTEAAAAYQGNGQTFQGTAVMSSSAPEFTWLASGSTVSGGSSQISEMPVDVASTGDLQGVILAALSKTNTCWFAVQLDATPTPIASDTAAFEATATQTAVGSETGAATGGTFYAKLANGQANCDAAYPATQKAFGWGTSYSSPGSA
jgi:type IV pilus assembly protein PilA